MDFSAAVYGRVGDLLLGVGLGLLKLLMLEARRRAVL
jgi:hypothetical protein